MPVGIITAVGTAIAGDALAIGGGTLLGALELGGVGAAIGAGTSAIFGRDPGKGALFGALGGIAQEAAPFIGDSLGIGAVGGLTVAEAAAGGIGAAATGGNIGKGILFGGAEGFAAGELGDLLSPAGKSPGGAAGGPAGGGTAAATAAAAGGTPDLTFEPVTDVGAGGLATAATRGLGDAPIESMTGPALTGGGDAIPGIDVTASRGVGSLSTAAVGAGSSGIGQIGTDGIDTSGAKVQPVTGTSLDGVGGNIYGSGDSLSTPETGNAGIANPGNASPYKTSFGRFVHDPSLHNAGDVLASNPAAVLGTLGLGVQAISQPHLPGAAGLSKNLNAEASALQAQGAQLQSFITNGQLPPGAQAVINNATSAAKATVRSRFAALGLSGSTSEATELANIDQMAAGQVFTIANDLLQSGIKESTLSAEIYKTLLSETDQQTQNMSAAIANFATAIAGGGRGGINVNVGGQAA